MTSPEEFNLINDRLLSDKEKLKGLPTLEQQRIMELEKALRNAQRFNPRCLVIYQDEKGYSEVNKIFREPSALMSNPEHDALEWLYDQYCDHEGDLPAYYHMVIYEYAPDQFIEYGRDEIEEKMRVMARKAKGFVSHQMAAE